MGILVVCCRTLYSYEATGCLDLSRNESGYARELYCRGGVQPILAPLRQDNLSTMWCVENCLGCCLGASRLWMPETWLGHRFQLRNAASVVNAIWLQVGT